MTDPKLREARIARAKEMAAGPTKGQRHLLFAHILIDLIEQDWRPEPEVDAVTLAAREWGAADYPMGAQSIMAGESDDQVWARAFRAGHAHAQATCADVRRMDWLEGQTVDVYAALERQISHAQGRLTDLRTKIDRAMEGGE